MTSPQPRPETINQLRNGAESSLAMAAGVQLDLFTPLKDGPMTLEQMAGALDVRAVKLRPLLYALVVAGLLNVDGELFSNTPEAEHFLVQTSPGYMGGAISDLPRRWSAMLNTAESIRTGLPQAKLDFSEGSEEELERFLRAIQPGAMAHARELVDRHDFSSCRTLADVGGGSGGLAMVIAEACPQVKATVIDLPTVTPIAQRVVRESAAADRISRVSGRCHRWPDTRRLRCGGPSGFNTRPLSRRRGSRAQERLRGPQPWRRHPHHWPGRGQHSYLSRRCRSLQFDSA